MIRRTGCWFLCLVALAWMGSLAWAGETASKDKKPVAKNAEPAAKRAEPAAKDKEPGAKSAEESASTPPATHTIKRGPLKVTVDLEGIFEAQTSQEILVKPEEWTTLMVEDAVAHGAQVRKGDVLLTLETEKLDQAIADLQADLNLSKVSVQQSEDQLQALDKITPLDVEASQARLAHGGGGSEVLRGRGAAFRAEGGRLQPQSGQRDVGVRAGRTAPIGEDVQGRRHHRGDRADRVEAGAGHRREGEVQWWNT